MISETRKKQVLIVGSLALFIMGCLSSLSLADNITLTDDNSIVTVNPTSQSGMNSWIVDGKSCDAKQWFWYRIGTSGPEQSIDSLPLTGSTCVDSDTDGGGYDTINLTYENAQLQIYVQLRLMGSDPGTGNSDISEIIKLKNKTTSYMDLHFFQYNNFTLSDHDRVAFDDMHHVTQWVSSSNEAVQEDCSESGDYAEASVTGSPLHEAYAVPITLNKLNDGVPTTLDGNGSAGPGNVSWAFEWDLSGNHHIAPGGTYTISKNKILQVPEPSTVAILFSLAAVGLGLGCRRKF
jgi:hypothetical protein